MMKFRHLPLCACLLLLLPACQEDKPTAEPPAPAAAPVTAASAPQAPLENTGGGDAVSYAPAGFRVIWNDEFNYEGLPDTNKWTYQVGGFGWLAEEQQMYTKADPDNAFVRDGRLVITALEEAVGQNKYTSTRLVTKKKALFRQGYYEARIRFPAGEGLRSAWWMVGDTVSKIGWPNAGEIDLVEHYGKVPNYVNAAVQTVENVWNEKGQKGGATELPTASTDFHVYSCLWTEQKISFFVDGVNYWNYSPDFLKPQSSWPFNWPFYMAFNLSVGGIRGQQSNNIPPGIFPASLEVDYVRVYQPTQ